MQIVSVNLNGIRSAGRKGFFEWMNTTQPDIVCMQETRAQVSQLGDALYEPEGYHRYFFDAERKGYSGVAIYSRHEPDNVSRGLGWACADDEGRYIQADFGRLSVASLYMPSGTSGDERQALKFDFLDRYTPILQQQRQGDQRFIVCGDWNIAHKEIDLKNWKSNQKNSGFLPEERAWMDKLFDELGYVDAFRHLNTSPDQYTWWSNRGQAYAKNVGWRIDYQVISPELAESLQSVDIYKEIKFSDHAPLLMDYDFTPADWR